MFLINLVIENLKNNSHLFLPMKARDLKIKYLQFFESKGHTIIPSAPLIPEHDPSVLFTTAGMHPLVPFLLGTAHPLGKRLVNVQKCMRTQDIDEVGDATHTTFFEMLGNWSLGDYFKKEAISWSFEFLTSKQWLNLPIRKLAVTCFAGDADAPKDEESAKIWLSLGISKERLVFLPKKDNWWGPAGETGPCGPDTEMFYWVSDEEPPRKFDPADKRWVEIWNNVFMEYNKMKDGKFIPLKQKNVDTGLGVERVTMILQRKKTVFDTELFQPIFAKIRELAGVSVNEENILSFRIVADHMRAATMILGDERAVAPSNVDHGYILRRFIRRTIRHGRKLGITKNFCPQIADVVINMFKDDFPLLVQKKLFILAELQKEEEKFEKTLEQGLKEFTKMSSQKVISGKGVFLLFQSYGFPLEMTQELAFEKGITVDAEGFQKEYALHQELSRVGAEKRFKGGLSEVSSQTVKYHTATHVLNEALRKVISPTIHQRGSNITPERLRFDFSFDRKLTSEEVKKVEDEVNQIIQLGLPVRHEEMDYERAMQLGAEAEFGVKYPSRVSVYFVGNYSLELCGGPHVQNTKDIGKFKIVKEESVAAGVRRIKAVVE